MMKLNKFQTGETMAKDIGPKLNAMVDEIHALQPHGDQSTIIVKRTPGGTYISALRRGGGSGGGGAETGIAKTTARTAAKTYTVDIYSRYESDGRVNTTYRTTTGDTMFTPGLNDTATADQLATGTILPVERSNIAGTEYWTPKYPIGLL